MSDNFWLKIVGLIVIGLLALAGIITYGIIKVSPGNDLEESKRMTTCVESGGSWTDVNPRKQSFDYGCIQK